MVQMLLASFVLLMGEVRAAEARRSPCRRVGEEEESQGASHGLTLSVFARLHLSTPRASDQTTTAQVSCSLHYYSSLES